METHYSPNTHTHTCKYVVVAYTNMLNHINTLPHRWYHITQRFICKSHHLHSCSVVQLQYAVIHTLIVTHKNMHRNTRSSHTDKEDPHTVCLTHATYLEETWFSGCSPLGFLRLWQCVRRACSPASGSHWVRDQPNEITGIQFGEGQCSFWAIHF